jgi:hypothetical protein
MDVGQDLIPVELDDVGAVEDADPDRHDEHGHRDQEQVAGRRHPVA